MKTKIEIADFNFLKENGTYWIAFDVAENWGIYAENIQAYGKGENKLYWTTREILKKIHEHCYNMKIKNLNIELVWAGDIFRNHKTTAKLSELKGMIKGLFMEPCFDFIKTIETFAYNENLALTFIYKKLTKEGKYTYLKTEKDIKTLNAEFPNRPKERKDKKLLTNLLCLQWHEQKYFSWSSNYYVLMNQDLCDAWMMWLYHWVKTKTDGQFENDT